MGRCYGCHGCLLRTVHVNVAQKIAADDGDGGGVQVASRLHIVLRLAGAEAGHVANMVGRW